jgi:hypothetical protein
VGSSLSWPPQRWRRSKRLKQQRSTSPAWLALLWVSPLHQPLGLRDGILHSPSYGCSWLCRRCQADARSSQRGSTGRGDVSQMWPSGIRPSSMTLSGSAGRLRARSKSLINRHFHFLTNIFFLKERRLILVQYIPKLHVKKSSSSSVGSPRAKVPFLYQIQ